MPLRLFYCPSTTFLSSSVPPPPPPSSAKFPSLLPFPSSHLRFPSYCSSSTTTTTTANPILTSSQKEGEGEGEEEKKDQEVETRREMTAAATRNSSSNSSWWWWKRALGQRLNGAGLFWFAAVIARDRRLAVPHLSVPDIRSLDWDALQRAGFRGVIFDKDNTLTAPYSLALCHPLANSFASCTAAFPNRVAVFSNSAGLYEYDPDGSHARAIEDSIEGVHVIRHVTKKPAGNAEEIEKYFGCSASHLIMVGDRYFTDVVYGNRNGFLTILTEPLSSSHEPFIVQQVRRLESYLVNYWYRKGTKQAKHSLLQDSAEKYVKIPFS